MERQLTVEESAVELGVSNQTIYTYIRQGKLKAVKWGKTWKIKQSEIDYIREYGLRE